MGLPFQHLVITDGTTDDAGIRNEVDLLSSGGFCLLQDGDWRPAITEPKGGGVWKDSALADGRVPADFKAQNVIEQMMLTVTALDQDQLIRDTQELRRLLTKARTYGATQWQTEPVWVEAQSLGESEMRYAILWDYRTPNDGNPYEQPFWQTLAGAGMDDFTLTLEREPYWRADEPGSRTCAQIASYNTYCWPCYVEFNGTNTSISVPDNAQIRDLHNAQMTAEAWIRIDSWSAGGEVIIEKGQAIGQGWQLWVSSTSGLMAKIECATQNGYAYSGTDDISVDGEWVHVAFTWDNATYNYPRLWIGGVEPSYVAWQNRGGAIQSDNGRNLFIGCAFGASNFFDGDIGWVRVSNTIRYNATFTPPPRCRLPDIDAGTQGQWIGAECSGNTIDNQEGLAAIDGTLANGAFDCDCQHVYGSVDSSEAVDPTCSEGIYVGNKQNVANITHVFTWSAANGFSANLVGGGFPFALVDIAGAAPAIGDYVAFGVDTNMLDSGPFASLVFDIGTAMSGMDGTWDYSTGVPGWNPLTVQDNTDTDGLMTGSPFDTTGIGSVHWEQPAAWATQAVNGITGFWVRMRLTAVPGPHVAPTQQHREIYSITWAFIEALADAVGGDVPALAQLKLRNESDDFFLTLATPNLWSTRVLIGMRSVDRGDDFVAYINLAEEQNPVGISMAATAVPGFTADPETPTGWKFRATNVGADATLVDVLFTAALAQSYTGRFRLFMRVHQYTGAAGDINLYFQIRSGIGTNFANLTGRVYTSTTNDWELMDFGQVTLVPTTMLAAEIPILALRIIGDGDGAVDIDLFDIILLPVDEWAIDTFNPYPGAIPGMSALGGRGSGTTDMFLDVNSIDLVKLRIRSILKLYDTGTADTVFMPVTAGPAIAQSNARIRYWFLQEDTSTTPSIESQPEIAGSLLMNKVQRYFSMRGDR